MIGRSKIWRGKIIVDRASQQSSFDKITGKRKRTISEGGKETRIMRYDACVSGLGLWCMNSRSRKIRRNHERISSPPTHRVK